MASAKRVAAQKEIYKMAVEVNGATYRKVSLSQFRFMIMTLCIAMITAYAAQHQPFSRSNRLGDSRLKLLEMLQLSSRRDWVPY